MFDPETSRLSRLTAILQRLQSRRLVTATDLAATFGVSVRTIYRDIRALEESGVPVVTEEGKGYSLMEGYRLPPVMFTEGEANALITAEQIIRAGKDESLIREFAAAVQKIKAVLPGKDLERTELLAQRVIVKKGFVPGKASKHLLTLQRALTNYLLVEIDYESARQAATTRLVEPFALYNSWEEDWTLIAFCRLREDFRSFRVDRITRLRLLDEPFQPHSMTLEQYVKKFVTFPDNP